MSRVHSPFLSLSGVVAVLAAIAVLAAPAARAGTPGSGGGGRYYGGVRDRAADDYLVGWKIQTDPGAGPVYCITASRVQPQAATTYRRSSGARLPSARIAAAMIALYGRPISSDADIAYTAAEVSLHVEGNTAKYRELLAVGLSQHTASALWTAAAGHVFAPSYGPPVFLGLETTNDPGARVGRTYPARVHVPGAKAGVRVTLAATGAGTISATALRTDAHGDATFTYRLSRADTPLALVASVSSGGRQPTLERYIPHSSRYQTLVGVGARTKPQILRGRASVSIHPSLTATIVKYTAGDATRAPVAGAVFDVTDTTTGHHVATITTATTPVPLPGLIPGDSYRVVEIQAPPGTVANGGHLYAPSAPFTATIPRDVPADYALAFADPLVPVLGLASHVGSAHLNPGARLTDTVSLTGDDGESGQLTARLLFRAPGADGTCGSLRSPDWSTATVLGRYSVPIVASFGDGHGNGDYLVTATAVPSSPGCYGFDETATLQPSGAVVHSPASAPNETTLVSTVGLSTHIDEPAGHPGDVLRDVITVTGTAAAGGQITVTLTYRPAPAAGCAKLTSADWTAYLAHTPAAVVHTEQIAVDADGELTSTGFTVRAAGCYTYLERYTRPGSPGSSAATSPGLALESAAITPVAPRVIVVSVPTGRPRTAGGSEAGMAWFGGGLATLGGLGLVVRARPRRRPR